MKPLIPIRDRQARRNPNRTYQKKANHEAHSGKILTGDKQQLQEKKGEEEMRIKPRGGRAATNAKDEAVI